MPAWLCIIIKKLMAKRVVDRYRSADEIAELLTGCLAHVQPPSKAARPEQLSVAKPRARRNHFPPLVKWIAAAASASTVFTACTLVILEQDKGTLKIESDLESVAIRITQGDKVVEKLTVTGVKYASHAKPVATHIDRFSGCLLWRHVLRCPRVIAGLLQACIIGCASQFEIGDQRSFNALLQQYVLRVIWRFKRVLPHFA
jgi:hypothetical protein